MSGVLCAAWQHVDARAGFEVVFLRREADGYSVDGHVTAVEKGVPWSVHYAVTLDAGWTTRLAEIAGRSEAGEHRVTLESDRAGGWLVEGAPAPHLSGCPDVDLEASAFTNTLPVNRLRLEVGERADAPAAYVRVPDLRVERLEQSYACLEDEAGRARYDCRSPAFGFRAVLVYDDTAAWCWTTPASRSASCKARAATTPYRANILRGPTAAPRCVILA